MADDRKKKRSESAEALTLEFKPGEQREAGILPVRHTVPFPFALLPLNIGRPNSAHGADDAIRHLASLFPRFSVRAG